MDVNGTPVGRVFTAGAADCADPPETTQLTVSRDTFNTVAAVTDVVINLIASPGVNASLCDPVSFVTVRLAHEIAGPNRDCNGNGNPDLAVLVGRPDSIAILLNRGDGSFDIGERIELGGCPRALAAGDIDGDGDTDLVMARCDERIVQLFRNDGNASFSQDTTLSSETYVSAVELADLDGDGAIDLVTLDRHGGDPGKVSILFNGTERSRFDLFGSSVAVADLDADHDLDLILVDREVTLLLNDGQGSFDNVVVLSDPVSVLGTSP